VYVFGTARLANPLHVPLYVDGKVYRDHMSERYGGKTKTALTRAIQKDGYDGVVVDNDEVIVFDPASVAVDKEKTGRSIAARDTWI
jgi:hypothetical protein